MSERETPANKAAQKFLESFPDFTENYEIEHDDESTTLSWEEDAPGILINKHLEFVDSETVIYARIVVYEPKNLSLQDLKD